MDREKIMKGMRLFLEGIGEDPKRPGLQDTPKRVAEMCEEIFGGIGVDPGKEIKVLQETGHDEIVLLRDLPFYST
ncbi:MAG: GTP cyclohydrolase I, partial [Candidatus Bathyanammoxibius sp.]